LEANRLPNALESLGRGWRKIPARRFEKMTPEERRELELDENASRLDLSPHEMSKLRMREIEEAEAEEVSVQFAPKSQGGRPTGGDREVARKLGTPREEIRRTRKHIAVAELSIAILMGLGLITLSIRNRRK
jgi:hypothetical protein